MQVHSLHDMVKGWFVGNFEPAALRTDAVEVAVKRYRAGDYEPRHHHRIATEITVVVQGRVRMREQEFGEGSIVVLHPYEDTDFLALTDAVNVVVKLPGASNDKYEGPHEGATVTPTPIERK